MSRDFDEETFSEMMDLLKSVITDLSRLEQIDTLDERTDFLALYNGFSYGFTTWLETKDLLPNIITRTQSKLIGMHDLDGIDEIRLQLANFLKDLQPQTLVEVEAEPGATDDINEALLQEDDAPSQSTENPPSLPFSVAETNIDAYLERVTPHSSSLIAGLFGTVAREIALVVPRIRQAATSQPDVPDVFDSNIRDAHL